MVSYKEKKIKINRENTVFYSKYFSQFCITNKKNNKNPHLET